MLVGEFFGNRLAALGVRRVAVFEAAIPEENIYCVCLPVRRRWFILAAKVAFSKGEWMPLRTIVSLGYQGRLRYRIRLVSFSKHLFKWT